MSVNPANPPRPALIATDKDSFAYITTVERWPVIVTKIVDEVYKSRHSLDLSEVDKLKEGKEIIDSIGGLKYQMQRKKPLIPIEDDGKSDIGTWTHVFNTYFKDENWYSATWLFVECYLYRRIHSIFARTKHWKDYDPFFRQKEVAFKASFIAVIEIAKYIDELIYIPKLPADNEKIDVGRIIFHELVQISLWGNSTDLSLLTNLSNDDFKKLQDLGTKRLKELEKNILANDLEKAWNYVSENSNARIDIILDNAGFEFYVDLVLSDWLIQSGYAKEIHLHAKKFPWFVSDTTLNDFNWLFQTLQSEDFFSSASEMERSFLKKLSNRLQSYIANYRLILTSDCFWTSPYAYWHLAEQAPDLYADLCTSNLVIFKGDLNYRKLIYDCKWKTTTPFNEAIGPLSSIKGSPSILALRTMKADVVVGLEEGIEERLSSNESDWMYSGKYAVIQFNMGNK
ncbi:9838_t:CDS:2 [Cetraspora pellucida]|uniref:Sugar phosphate phosphatase n=1 Tax=Cetraspora pellucida TaxID=1433469 RepID=A0A9N9EGH8_9GLOM|nr:9838_t:CDS:2 [Cetraspora pellucida]